MFDFKYTQNPEAETPLMFIDKEIGGKDADGNENIQGSDFLKELLYLSDTLMKRNICIWINSPGGYVTEGESIYTGMLKSKANVDTYCYGDAASIAGVIFQAGKKRIMTPSARLMYHPAYSEDGSRSKGLEAVNKSVIVMIAQRTGKSVDEVWNIMNEGKKDDKGTWMDADYACANGFADEKDNAFIRNLGNVTTRFAITDYYNKTITKPEIKMSYKNLNKAMGLNEEAAENAAIEVFNSLNKKNDDLEDRLNKAKDAYDALNAEMDAFKKAKMDDEAKAKAKADEDAVNKAKEDEDSLNKKADEDLKNAVTAGKIKNDAGLIASYKAMYLKAPKETVAAIEALPINKVSPTFNAASGDQLKDTPAEAQARLQGLKPGTSAWLNTVKLYEINTKTSTIK